MTDINSIKGLQKEDLNSEQGQKIFILAIISNTDYECTQYFMNNMSVWAIADTLAIACENRNQIAIDYLIPKISKSSLRKLIIKSIKEQAKVVIELLLENSEYLRENDLLYEFIVIASNGPVHVSFAISPPNLNTNFLPGFTFDLEVC